MFEVLYLPAVKVTFEFLVKVANLAAQNVQCGCWNKGTMTAYLCTCGVAALVRNTLWIICQRNDDVMDIDNNTDTDDNNKGEHGDNYAQSTLNPSSVLPKMWESVLSVEIYFDCGMHPVFHGLGAYCVEQMENVIKDQDFSQQFEQMANTHLHTIK